MEITTPLQLFTHKLIILKKFQKSSFTLTFEKGLTIISSYQTIFHLKHVTKYYNQYAQ